MNKPRALVFSGYGLNCEEETRVAFELSGARADIIHINDLIDRKHSLADYQILAFPGGFSYGDDTGSGNAFANRVRNHLWEKILRFIEKDRLVIGICNGFQVLVNLGILPALGNRVGQRQIALVANKIPRYLNRWVDLKVENSSPWLSDLNTLSLPIAHGEGRFYAEKEVLQKLTDRRLIALRYTRGEICSHFAYEPNPNGSLDSIAGITDESKKVFGLMPHPERGMFFTQLPHWTYLKERYIKEGKRIPYFASGLQIFKNGVKYFS